MKIEIHNSHTYVSDATKDDLAWLYGFLSFEDVKAEQRRRQGFHVKQEDTRVRLFDRRKSRFPTGLVSIVCEGASKKGISISFEDLRGPNRKLEPFANLEAEPWNMTGKWSFQREAIEAAIRGEVLDGRGIVKSPTGSGKGNLAAAIPYVIPGRWLFVVHRGHLAADVRERWDRMAGPWLGPAGFIGDGEWTVGDRLTCATLQTLHRAMKRGDERFDDLVAKITGVEVDECHVAPAASYFDTIQAFEHARYRFGLSGTPLDRGDRRSLMAIGSIGPLVFEIKARDLIDAGVLAEPRIRVIPCWQRASQRARGDWKRTYDELIVESSHRNGAVLAAMAHALEHETTPGIVFVRRKEHGKTITKIAAKRGLNVAYVDGSKDTAARRKAITDLEAGKLDFIVATKVFVEGVNVPELRTVINAAGGKSVIEALQQVGRGTRTTDEKSTFEVYEIGDKGEPVLNNHARSRFRAYKREGYPTEVAREIWPERAGE